MPSRRAESKAEKKGGRKGKAAKEDTPEKAAVATADTESTGGSASSDASQGSQASQASEKKPTQAQLYAAVLKARIAGLDATKAELGKEAAARAAKAARPKSAVVRPSVGLASFTRTIAALQAVAADKPRVFQAAKEAVEADPYELLVADVTEARAKNTFVIAFAKNLKELIQYKQDRYADLYDDLKVSLDELERQLSLLSTQERTESPDRYRVIAIKSAMARVNELALTVQAYSDIFFPTPGKSKETSEILAVRDRIAGKTDATPAEAWYALVSSRLRDVLKSEQGFGGLGSEAQRSVRSALAKLVRSLAKGFAVFQKKYYNMVLMGPPGIGKTRLARIIGFIMSNLLILFNNKTIELSSSSFTAEFEGQTGPKTLNLLMNGLESVIFLDEAYNLPRCDPAGGPPPGNGYGGEAITEIVQFMSTYKGMYMMIVAGYERPMKECFLMSNEGFDRRFDPSYRIVLPRYGVDDMLLIFRMNIKKDLPDLTPLEVKLLEDCLVRPTTGLVALGLFPSNASDIEALVSELSSAVSNQYEAFSEMPDAKDYERTLKRLYTLVQGLNDYTKSRGVEVTLGGITDPREAFGFLTKRLVAKKRMVVQQAINFPSISRSRSGSGSRRRRSR